MSISFLRPAQVTERRGRGRSQLYVDVGRGVVTPPIRVSSQVSVWPDYEIDALNKAEIAGATPDELRTLVKQLVAQRAQMKPV